MKTLYDILEVSPAASTEVLAASHRALARRFHPDNKPTANPQRFREVQQAWERLKDPDSRAEYDRYLDDECRKAVKEPDHAPAPALPIDQIIARTAADAVRSSFGHIPGVKEFVNAYEKPAAEAIRQGLGMARETARRRRAG